MIVCLDGDQVVGLNDHGEGVEVRVLGQDASVPLTDTQKKLVESVVSSGRKVK